MNVSLFQIVALVVMIGLSLASWRICLSVQQLSPEALTVVKNYRRYRLWGDILGAMSLILLFAFAASAYSLVESDPEKSKNFFGLARVSLLGAITMWGIYRFAMDSSLRATLNKDTQLTKPLRQWHIVSWLFMICLLGFLVATTANLGRDNKTLAAERSSS